MVWNFCRRVWLWNLMHSFDVLDTTFYMLEWIYNPLHIVIHNILLASYALRPNRQAFNYHDINVLFEKEKKPHAREFDFKKIRIWVVIWDKENDFKKIFKLQQYSVSSRKLVCYTPYVEWLIVRWRGMCVHIMYSREAKLISLMPWWQCIAPHLILSYG